MVHPRLPLLLLGLGIACSSGDPVDGPAAPLQINELVAANHTGQPDPTGTRTDWLELYNPGAAPVSLEGWSIGPDYDRRVRFDPSLAVPATGHLVLWADDRPADGPDQLPFRLDVDGESLALFTPDGLQMDGLSWGPLLPDLALARTADGGPGWQVVTTPTPGAPNAGTPGTAPIGSTDCLPTATADRPQLTEGETVTLTATCPGVDADFAWFGTVADTGPTVAWTPSLAEAGTHTLLLAASDPALSTVPVTARLTLEVADRWQAPENVPVDPATYLTEWGLPVLHLDADPTLLTQEYSPTDAWFEGLPYTAQMKIRGAASAGYPKNNFTIEFDPEQLPLGHHGLSNKDHLVLVGNFDDNAHVRQRLVYDTWAAMAAFWAVPRLTPRSTPVVLYMNGAYHGLYLALDHVDDEFLREMGLESGSDLYKSVSHDANFYLTDAGGGPKGWLGAGWEKKEGLDLADTTVIEELTAWSGSIDPATFATEAPDRLDLDEIADWLHLVQAFAADDSAGKNAYLYLDPADARLRYVPWDFNHGAGQTWQTARQTPDGVNDYLWNNGLFRHLQTEPTLAAALWDRRRAMAAPTGPLSTDALLALLEAYDTQLGAHPDRDWEKWGPAYHVYGLWSWRTDWTTPAEERAYVEDWLVARAAVLDQVSP